MFWFDFPPTSLPSPFLSILSALRKPCPPSSCRWLTCRRVRKTVQQHIPAPGIEGSSSDTSGRGRGDGEGEECVEKRCWGLGLLPVLPSGRCAVGGGGGGSCRGCGCSPAASPRARERGGRRAGRGEALLGSLRGNDRGVRLPGRQRRRRKQASEWEGWRRGAEVFPKPRCQ